MARRLSSAAPLLLLVLSLVAVAHCRPLEADPESAAAVAAGDDENGPPNPTLPTEAGAGEVVLPAEQQRQHGFLRLPSHGYRHRPCRHGLFQRHLWWARHHGAFGEDAPRRFHRHGEALSHSHLIASPSGEAREVKAVAEPDPDRSLPDGDGEGQQSFGDADGAHAHEEAASNEDEGAAVRAWRKEMQRRWWLHHHGMRLHRHHRDEEEEGAEGLKRFHHHDEEEKRFRRAGEHDDESDSEDEDEDEEVEELVRRFRKAIMRRRSGHGRRFHHHHRYAGEAEKADAAQEEGGVVSWIKDLIMNRF
jgi:hypothetical protein